MKRVARVFADVFGGVENICAEFDTAHGWAEISRSISWCDQEGHTVAIYAPTGGGGWAGHEVAFGRVNGAPQWFYTGNCWVA